MALYRGYGDRIVLNGADALVVHPCRDGGVVVLEYEVFGRVVASDATYENRFVSIVTIENRKVVLWRDYMDSLAACARFRILVGELLRHDRRRCGVRVLANARTSPDALMTLLRAGPLAQSRALQLRLGDLRR